jgi:hypothetical protein
LFRKVEAAGIELLAQNGGNLGDAAPSGAENGALGGNEDPCDPQLAMVVEAWLTLAEPIKAGIVAMIRAAKR